MLSIPKTGSLLRSENYRFLREEGLKYIEELSSNIWTDYNTHDPGITMLEVLCYALTDLGYRTTFDVKDLLAPPPPSSAGEHTLFTARQILTTHPTHINDYRKLLIDIDGINNAWLFPDACPQEIPIFADCQQATLSFEETPHAVNLSGLYLVLLEFSVDEAHGDLNDPVLSYTVSQGASLAGVRINIHFPGLQAVVADFTHSTTKLDQISTSAFQDLGGGKWQGTLNISYTPEGESQQSFSLTDLSFEVVSNPAEIDLTATRLQAEFGKIGASSILQSWQNKLVRTAEIVLTASERLQAHRNLCEDFLKIEGVQSEEVAICADVEVRADADLEEVQAYIYYLIQTYLNPRLGFYSLKEMLEAGRSTDEIFEGPKLSHGFIDTEELEAAQLRETIYASDIINLIMDIEGVVAVKSLVMTKYDQAGNPGPAEPWCLKIKPYHKPLLSLEKSRFLFFKGKLPFTAQRKETLDTLALLEAVDERKKQQGQANDLDIPIGTHRDTAEYLSIQHEFPLTYGLDPAGLPPSATDERFAQAKQLKAYLLFYDQLLANYLSQLANVRQLFSLDESISQTYFSQYLSEINDIEDLYVDAVSLQTNLNSLTESSAQFYDRRNRFLDHLLGRFSEQFTDYVLLLYSSDGTKVSEEELIHDKIAFLRDYPMISSERGKAFDYTQTDELWDTQNVSGLEKRIVRLLGIERFERASFCVLETELYAEEDEDLEIEIRWRVKIRQSGKIVLSSSMNYPTEQAASAEMNQALLLAQEASNYQLLTNTEDQFYFNIVDESQEVVARRIDYFGTDQERQEAITELIDLLQNHYLREGLHLVEHLLLRPKSEQDQLMQVCLSDSCEFYGEEDPYSFRMTFVAPYWPERFMDMNFRRMAEDLIRSETPAHIALKICWIDQDQMCVFEDSWKAWLEAHADPAFDESERSNRLAQLIDIMESLRTVYPVARLHDCEDDNDFNPVLLDNTILGTYNSEENGSAE